jgi:phytoene dehydrogenase-like protein
LHTAGPLSPQLLKDLQLESLNRRREPAAPDLIALHPDSRALRFYRDPQRTADGLEPFSVSDARKYREFDSSLSRLGSFLRPFVMTAPPDIDHLKIADYLNFGKLGLKFRGLERKDAYRLLRWGPMPVADLAAEWFEDELLRATIAARGIFGSFAGPRSAGTSAGVLLHAALGGDSWLLPGGAGALAHAFAKAAAQAGAEIRTNAEVTHIRVKDTEVHSVVLQTGEEIAARAIVSNADPQRTFLKLMDAADFDPGFLMKVRAYRAVGTVAKVNLALSGLPNFAAMSQGSTDLAARIHIGPDTDYLERAFDAAKYGHFSDRPYMDVCIPTVNDTSLAPDGCHVMSVHVQYAPYRLSQGDWNTRRNDFGDAVVKALDDYAPGIRNLIVHRQVITPLDMEQTYGLTGGHVFHGEHALDQLFIFRPVLGWAQYRTPIKGLYLCGSGTHPGGGVTGVPGSTASGEIIKDLRGRR